MKVNPELKNQLYASFFVLGILFFSSCNLYRPVMVNEIGNIKTRNPLTSPEIQFDVNLVNPNKFGVTIKKMEIGISMGGPVMATVSLMEGTRIAARDTVSVPVVLRPSVNEISELFSSGIDSFWSGKKDRKLKAEGEIVIKKFFFRKRYKIKESIRW